VQVGIDNQIDVFRLVSQFIQPLEELGVTGHTGVDNHQAVSGEFYQRGTHGNVTDNKIVGIVYQGNSGMNFHLAFPS